ncbi:uncharacterized protein LOC143846836 [Tasmannia lanceolata]|uniref:uncharacterized protein LOC143846836 n=1 Tax=Tasmannia lanceolata TaxID=3420 RepID=UPI0040636148
MRIGGCGITKVIHEICFRNVRGLGTDKKIWVVRDIVVERKFDLLSIIETKIMGVADTTVNKLWGRNNRGWVAKEAVGSAGGVIIIWKEAFCVEEVSIKRFSITLLLSSTNWNENWKLTTVYGPAKARERSGLWVELKEIRDSCQGPWIVGGDFNTIRFPAEKSRLATINRSMRNLSNFIQDSQLIDLPLLGAKYTWSNNQDNLIMSRLDRVLISNEWDEAFPRICQSALPKPTSDYNPMMLEVSDYSGGPRPFRLNLALCENPKLEELISKWWDEEWTEEEWTEGWKGFILFKKLKHLKKKVKEWQKSEEAASKCRKEEIIVALNHLERKEEQILLNTEEKMERAALMEEHEEILRREEIGWRQKSRGLWLKEGDNNSKYFHLMASMRRRINFINSIRDGESLIEDRETIKDMIISFYSNLYTIGALKLGDWGSSPSVVYGRRS